jgi:uncharacterized membrane protein
LAAEIPTTHRDAPKSEGVLIQWLLRTGLGISVALMAAGLAVQLGSGARHSNAVRMFELARAPASLGERVMALGILVLAFTPVLRVVALVLLWVKERDWRFVAVALTVAATLALAIALGGG